MIGRVNRPGLTAGAAALLTGLSGCADPAPCAGWGVVTDVAVYFVQDGYGDLAGASAEVCTRGGCEKGPLKREDISRVFLALPDDPDPDTAPVRFRVTRKGATTPFIDESVEVKLLHQSDGCGGGGYSRALAFTKEDGLLKSVPKAVGAAWMKQVRGEATALPTDATTTPSPRPPARTAAGTPTG
ncbi:hypothetical protein ABZ464_14840 [Streptomyces sp. NPDC005820]|uniref:hypothetical protein n=1 Tax=Streptomyces sp. NPDC005820 TaxID=3157069 RepID=UPI00340E85FC